MRTTPHFLLVLDFAVIACLCLANVATVIWVWKRLREIHPPESEWRRWRKRLSVTTGMTFLHLYLITWWVSVAPLGLPWLIHVLFTVFHSGWCLMLMRYHFDVVNQARLWAILTAYLGETEVSTLVRDSRIARAA
jgi:hypothetical protein